jgi:hypothetical protein
MLESEAGEPEAGEPGEGTPMAKVENAPPADGVAAGEGTEQTTEQSPAE